ncbi:MAG: nucleotide exchange factor GrpE [Anaerolineae bacterium]
MSERFNFDESFIPVPPAAVDADPAQTIRELMFRVSKLEHDLASQEAQAVGDVAEVMLDVVGLADDVAHIVQRWGVVTDAQQAALVRAVTGLGRKLQQVLAKHQVKPLAVIGQPYNPQTSEVASSEASSSMVANIVLREMEPGYVWKFGLLRKARVVISMKPEK